MKKSFLFIIAIAAAITASAQETSKNLLKMGRVWESELTYRDQVKYNAKTEVTDMFETDIAPCYIVEHVITSVNEGSEPIVFYNYAIELDNRLYCGFTLDFLYLMADFNATPGTDDSGYIVTEDLIDVKGQTYTRYKFQSEDKTFYKVVGIGYSDDSSVYHIIEDAQLTRLKAVYDNGQLVFEASDFTSTPANVATAITSTQSLTKPQSLTNPQTNNQPAFTLDGKIATDSTKGIVIQNGKKYIR